MENMSDKTLNLLEVGEHARIIQVKGKGGPRKRLLDMGMVPGATLRVIKKAPLGDPVDFKVKGYNLSLRKREAEMVVVEMLGD